MKVRGLSVGVYTMRWLGDMRWVEEALGTNRGIGSMLRKAGNGKGEDRGIGDHGPSGDQSHKVAAHLAMLTFLHSLEVMNGCRSSWEG